MSVEYPTYEGDLRGGTVVAYPVRVDLQQEDDVRLTAAVLSKLTVRKLPTVPLSRVWVGEGTGATCDVCERPIAPGEVEYEVNIKRVSVLHFHRECFVVWDRERAWYHAKHRNP